MKCSECSTGLNYIGAVIVLIAYFSLAPALIANIFFQLPLSAVIAVFAAVYLPTFVLAALHVKH